MTTIKCLPDEVIAVILGYESISIEDVVSFTSTCKRFHRTLLDRKFWETKFYQRCYIADNYYWYNQNERDQIFHQFDFKDQIKKSLTCIRKLNYYVSVISNDNFRESRKKELFSLLHFISKNDLIYDFVLEEISRKSFTSNTIWTRGNDLTRDYNSILLIQYLKQYCLKCKLEKYVKKPKKKQSLEELLTIVIQYFHPHISYTFINMWIDDIVNEVLYHLLMSHHEHSIFKKSSEDFSTWSDNDSKIHNYWNETESKQIMDTLEKFVFSQLDEHFYMYRLLDEIDYFYKPKPNDYIFRCLRIYLLTFTYYVVARRLGIHCKIKITHYTQCVPQMIISWKSDNNAENLDTTSLYLNHITPKLYPQNISKWSDIIDWNCIDKSEIDPIKIMITLMDECPYRINLLLSYNYEWNIKELYNLRDIVWYKTVANEIKLTYKNEVKGKKRRRNIKYSVGMIVQHSEETRNHKHYGVIVGWHYRCRYMMMEKNKFSAFPNLFEENLYSCDFCTRECKASMFMHTDKKKYFMQQPHYIILAHNNALCYAGQYAISICESPEMIYNNVEIGRYFTGYAGTHYIPNQKLSREYPYDDAVLRKMLANQ